MLLVACYATLHPALLVCPSVRRSIRPFVCRSIHTSVRHTLLFWRYCGIWSHCSCPNDQVTSDTASAHATGVAVYPALFLINALSVSTPSYFFLLLFFIKADNDERFLKIRSIDVFNHYRKKTSKKSIKNGFTNRFLLDDCSNGNEFRTIWKRR